MRIYDSKGTPKFLLTSTTYPSPGHLYASPGDLINLDRKLSAPQRNDHPWFSAALSLGATWLSLTGQIKHCAPYKSRTHSHRVRSRAPYPLGHTGTMDNSIDKRHLRFNLCRAGSLIRPLELLLRGRSGVPKIINCYEWKVILYQVKQISAL